MELSMRYKSAIAFFLALVWTVATVLQADTEAAVVPDELIYTVTEDVTSNAAVFGGGVIPHKMVNLLAQMPGEVDYIAGQEGDPFKAGADLVILDKDSLLAKRQAAVAGINNARAGLGNAYMQYRRELLTPNSQAKS